MRVHGGPGLKQTQLYTPEFGRNGCVVDGPWPSDHRDRYRIDVLLILNIMVRKANDSCVSQPGYRRERRRWSLVQSANLSLDAMKVGV